MMPQEPTTDNQTVMAAAPMALTEHVHCFDCHQDLYGTIADRCPECGADVADVRKRPSGIIWTYRATRGWVRTFARTVWMVLRHTRRLLDEAQRPVSFADAQAFRWMTVVLAWLPWALALLLAYMLRPPLPVPGLLQRRLGGVEWLESESRESFLDTFGPQAYRETWPLVCMLGFYLVFLVLATGVPSYFAYRRRAPIAVQNRFIALSYYTAAPLVLLILPLLFLGYLVGMRITIATSLQYALLAGLSVPLLLWLISSLRLSYRATQSTVLLVSYSIALPACWTALAVLILGIAPLLMFYVLVVWRSLR